MPYMPHDQSVFLARAITQHLHDILKIMRDHAASRSKQDHDWLIAAMISWASR